MIFSQCFAAAKISGVAIVSLSISLVASNAQALTLTGTSGEFRNPVGGINVNTTSGQINWGIGFPESTLQSSMAFTGVGATDSLPVDTEFILGTLTHFNNPLFAVSGVSSVELDITLDFASAGLQSLAFTLNIAETINAPPCNPSGTTVCPDIISWDGVSIGQPFNDSGTKYLLEILGFRPTPDSSLTNQLISEENQSNSTFIYAQVTEVAPVSTPAAILPILTGLFGSAACRKKEKKAK